MLLEFDGKRYPYRGLDLTPRQIMALQVELLDADFTTLRTFDDIRRLERDLMELPAEERAAHPEIMFYSAIVVFAALTTAGVAIKLDDLLDDPKLLTSVRQIPEPGDRQAGEGAGKARRRSGSGGGSRRSGKATKTRRSEPITT